MPKITRLTEAQTVRLVDIVFIIAFENTWAGAFIAAVRESQGEVLSFTRIPSDLAQTTLDQYPHGVIDPISEVAGAAQRVGIACHVDACAGGRILPWWKKASGEAVPAWDFAVAGVSSISADLHKYGYAPKGASLLLFADAELDRARYFSLTDWLGYPVVNPTVLGTRSATTLAAASAVVQALGEQGYVDVTAQVVRASRPVRRCAAARATSRSAPLGSSGGRSKFCAAGSAGTAQRDGTTIARTTHLTITPVTEGLLPELLPALRAGADDARGHGRPADASDVPADGIPDPAALAQAARTTGDIDLTRVLALIEGLPREQSAQLLTRFLAEFTAPR